MGKCGCRTQTSQAETHNNTTTTHNMTHLKVLLQRLALAVGQRDLRLGRRLAKLKLDRVRRARDLLDVGRHLQPKKNTRKQAHHAGLVGG